MRSKKKTMKKRLEPHGGEIFALIFSGAIVLFILIPTVGLLVMGQWNAWWWLFVFPAACLFWHRWWLWLQDWMERVV